MMRFVGAAHPGAELFGLQKYFVGVDLVGDKILEINVFAPGGIANINDLYEIDAATAIIRDLERKVELRSVYPDPIPPHVFMRA